jgi:hypothetical protein
VIPVITFSLAILTASGALVRQPAGYAGSAAR